MFEDVMGRNQHKIVEHPGTRKGVELWLERVLGYYGEDGGVDVEIIDGQLILNGATADYIYSDFTPDEILYKAGSRRLLEQVVAENVSEGMSEREKALALMRRVRDNRDRGLARPGLFYGGSEEELLKRGALMCNEVSRLYVCLCQIAGLPARVHCAHISGHMMSEVKTGGKWGWVDSMKGVAPVNDDGEPASVWELVNDPGLMERQPQGVWDDIRSPQAFFGDDEKNPDDDRLIMARARDCYFHPREATAIGNYFVWDYDRYTYPWCLEAADPERRRKATRAEYLNRRELGWPDYYFQPLLFSEDIAPGKQDGA
ncbi:MAG: transglutaminase domain-containing protein [Planctomycetes bacterium]|nr:transglutaminase domain-containing protein [Planctomycetota bacterium]